MNEDKVSGKKKGAPFARWEFTLSTKIEITRQSTRSCVLPVPSNSKKRIEERKVRRCGEVNK